MALKLDHLVILVRDLGAAVRDFRGAGFVVAPGGEHADGLTRNALVSFADGTYLELISFIDPEDTRDNVWGWRAFLGFGSGLIDHCLASEDLASDVRRLRVAGLFVDGPSEGGRKLPDGRKIRWSSASIRQKGRALPFLIEDLTPREARVPEAPHHPNGVLGIPHLSISAEAPDVRAYAALIKAPKGDDLRLGPCSLVFTPHSERPPGPATARLRSERGAESVGLDPFYGLETSL